MVKKRTKKNNGIVFKAKRFLRLERIRVKGTRGKIRQLKMALNKQTKKVRRLSRITKGK